MIAKVVFDLPLELPFDYFIPQNFIALVLTGVRVKAPLGPRTIVGYVVETVESTTITKIKPIKSVIDTAPLFDARDMELARLMAAFYGCTIGEALAVIVRHRTQVPKDFVASAAKKPTLYHCLDGQYQKPISDLCRDMESFVLIPDADAVSVVPKGTAYGTRAALFMAINQYQRIIIVDEEDGSFKEEQGPRYEARQVLMMAREIYGFELYFISQTPSVELMDEVVQGHVVEECLGSSFEPPTVIDLANYKFLDKGILAAPLRNALEANIKIGQKTIVVHDRRGMFSVTRCSTCGHVLKCPRCDSAMVFERSRAAFVCRHCGYQAADAGDCPACGVPSWKSYGFGIEKVQKEVAALFPNARISVFQRGSPPPLAAWDVLVTTSAVLAFEDSLKAATVAIVDIDMLLNRLDMRSSFKAWRLLRHAQRLSPRVMVQTRNCDHPVMKVLRNKDDKEFYETEFAIRNELKFTPFYHWVKMVVRGRSEKNALNHALGVYNYLVREAKGMRVNAVTPDVPAILRDQYRFQLTVGGPQVPAMITLFKSALTALKRSSSVIVTFEVDP